MPRPLQRIYAPLGHLVLDFANLENLVGITISGLLTTNTDLGAALVAELSFGKRLDALRSLMAAILKDDSALMERVDVCIKELSTVEMDRNRFIHSSWGVTDKGGVMVLKSTAKRKKGVVHQMVDYEPRLLTEARKRVETASKNLLSLVETFQECGLMRVNFYHSKRWLRIKAERDRLAGRST